LKTSIDPHNGVAKLAAAVDSLACRLADRQPILYYRTNRGMSLLRWVNGKQVQIARESDLATRD
jgi:hypothetical protein